MNEKVKDFFRNSAGYGMIALISAGYLATAFITVERSGKSVWRILADGVVVFFIGILLNRSFELQGMLAGDREESVTAALARHSAAVEQAAPHIDVLDDWCDRKNREALRAQRVRILAERGMKYEDYFDEAGMSREFVFQTGYRSNRMLRRLEMRRLRGYYKALSLKLTPLTSGVLTGEGGRYDDPYYLGRSKPEYARQTGRKDVIGKIVLSLLFGYFGIAFLANPSLATLIWKTLQISVFLAVGSLRRGQSYEFVTEEFRGRIVKKTHILQLFIRDMNLSEGTEKERGTENG